MGNCQAAEAATVVIQHPSGRVERVYWSLSASRVMAANPGHYVAVIITTTATSSDGSGGAPVKHLKLLRPDDTLHIGHVYRLVSFEEVLREFASKKHVKLSRLLVKQKDKPSSRRATSTGGGRGGGGERQQGGGGGGGGGGPAAETESSSATPQVVESPENVEAEFEELVQRLASNRRSSSGSAARHGQWRPALQSIAEIGS